MSKLRNGLCITVSGLLSALALEHSYAQGEGQSENRSDIGFKVGTGHSDNLFQRDQNETSGTYGVVGTLLDLYRDSRRLRAEVDGDLEYRDYSTAQTDDDVYGALDAEVELRAVPERFSWLFVEQYGEGRLDPLRPAGPDNREQINIFSTGPAVYLPLGPRTELRMSGLAGHRSYEESAFDNDAIRSTMGVYRQLSATSEIGFSASSRDVEYDNEAFDNTIDVGFISYRKQFASGEASLAVGGNRVDINDVTETRPYLNLSWGRDVGTRSNLTFNVSNRLLDRGDSFRGGQDLDDALRSVDVYERATGGITFAIESARSILSFGGRVGEDRYQNEVLLDNDLVQFDVSYERNLTPRLDGGLSLFTVEREFRVEDQRDDDLLLSLWFEKFFGRKMALNVEYRYNSRDGRNVTEFEENSIRVTIEYRLNAREPSF